MLVHYKFQLHKIVLSPRKNCVLFEDDRTTEKREEKKTSYELRKISGILVFSFSFIYKNPEKKLPHFILLVNVIPNKTNFVLNHAP